MKFSQYGRTYVQVDGQLATTDGSEYVHLEGSLKLVLHLHFSGDNGESR
jgi:hypothetical protein